MKAKFTTNIDKKLLEKTKIKAIQEGKNVNGIIENLLEEYLKGEKEMTYKLTAYEEGNLQETWTTGAIDEVIEQFNNDKIKGLEWIAENDEELYKEAISEEVTTKEELEVVLDMIDLNWWTLRLEEI